MAIRTPPMTAPAIGQSENAAPARTQIEIKDLLIRYGPFEAVRGVSFDVREGEHVTLLGPSGCGKTTTLRSIAGLEQPTSGEIRVDGKPLYSSAGRINIPTEHRGVSMVFQSYAVWPHMTVAKNVAYGLNVRKVPKAEMDAAVLRALDLVQMRDFAERPASMLSGGQQQRVALARAIAFSPSVVLFDEPLSNLDAKLRTSMRVELRDLQRRLRITSIYVTHDQEEALAISDRIIVMNRGAIEQIGTPEDIYDRPRTRFVADFVGSANILEAKILRGSATGTLTVDVAGQVLQVRPGFEPEGDAVEIAIRPSYATLTDAPPDGRTNAFPGRIRQRMFHGDFIEYRVEWPAGEIVVRRPPTEAFQEGAQVTVCVDPKNCVVLRG
jgi:iron(III) transport system ATP-binding protein